MTIRAIRMRRGIIRCAAALTLAACTDPFEVVQESLDATLGAATISPRVGILAVGQTLQLSTAATALSGVMLTDLDSVRYSLVNLVDTLSVTLGAAGLVTARGTSPAPIQINAIVFRNGQAKGDQALVQVTATALVNPTLSIQPAVGDSTKLAIGSTKTIVPVIREGTSGPTVNNPAMQYTVGKADRDRVGVYKPGIRLASGLSVQLPPSPTVSPNQILAQDNQGTAWIYATATVYGQLLRDSVQYTFTNPFLITIAARKRAGSINSTLQDVTTKLAPGATVTFSCTFQTGDPLQVTFAFTGPASPEAASPASTTGGASGNVTALSPGQSSRRRFTTPGTYKWTATATGGPAPWNGQKFSGTIDIE